MPQMRNAWRRQVVVPLVNAVELIFQRVTEWYVGDIVQEPSPTD